MSSNGKRDVLRSLDYLLYCHIAYTYFLDTSLLVLFFRILLQLVRDHRLLATRIKKALNFFPFTKKQLLSPRALTRSLRTALAIVTAGWLVGLLMHLATEPGEPGIIIDFIGNRKSWLSMYNKAPAHTHHCRTKSEYFTTSHVRFHGVCLSNCTSIDYVQSFVTVIIKRDSDYDIILASFVSGSIR